MAHAFQNWNEAESYAPGAEKPPGAIPVLGEGELNPEVMLVKRSPSYADYKGGKPLLGQDGLPIRKAMFGAGISYYATNAFPFVTKAGKVSIKDARAFAGVLSEEILRVNPANVVLLGADAARWTADFPVSFKKHNEVLGRTFESAGRNWCVTKAPGVITMVPSEYRAFLDSIQRLLAPPEEASAPVLPEKYTLIRYPMLAKTILRGLPRRVALDVETTSLDPYTCEVLMLQVSAQEGSGYAFPWGIMTHEEWAEALGDREWVCQNGSYDLKVLAARGIHLRLAEDTMLMHSLVDETPGTHSMESMSHRYLGIDKWSEMVDYSDMGSVPLETLAQYGARDTDLTLRLANLFKPQTEKRPIHDVLHGLQNALIVSEVRGVRVDRAKAQEFEKDIEGLLHDLAVKMDEKWELANANSPKQVIEKLLELGVPLQKTKGSYSSDEENISPFVETFPLVRDILEYRHLTKARGTYLRNILLSSEHDGRYHPDYHIARTETGRLVEKLITLIPRSEGAENPDAGHVYQMRLRELFVPDPGYVMVGADYSGLELGMAAYLSGDPVLRGHIDEGIDTHSLLAIRAFNLPVNPEPHDTLKDRVNAQYAHYRTLAKQLTFGYLFGSSGLSMTKFMSLEDATQLIDALRSQYQRLAAWQEEVRAQARKGYVETPWGRRRHFYYDAALGDKIHAQQDRECINFPIQAHATDMNSYAFTELTRRGYQTLWPLHDAVYLQVREGDVDRAVEDVKEVMENVLTGVKFRVDVHTGDNWAAL